MYGLIAEELEILKSLSTPQKIQDFVNKIPINFEKNGPTCMSPRMVLKKNTAHCLEGALFAAAALRINGYPPLIVNLETTAEDDAHTIAVFQINDLWGAISKTNHTMLRYREPVYKSIHELIMSYFHEYFLENGDKTLRSHTSSIDLSIFDHYDWMISDKQLWFIQQLLNDAEYQPVVPESQIQYLRKADPVELKVLEIVEWEYPDETGK